MNISVLIVFLSAILVVFATEEYAIKTDHGMTHVYQDRGYRSSYVAPRYLAAPSYVAAPRYVTRRYLTAPRYVTVPSYSSAAYSVPSYSSAAYTVPSYSAPVYSSPYYSSRLGWGGYDLGWGARGVAWGSPLNYPLGDYIYKKK